MDSIHSSNLAIKSFAVYLIMQVFIPMTGYFAESLHLIRISQSAQLLLFAVVPQFAAAFIISVMLQRRSRSSIKEALEIKPPAPMILMLCPLCSVLIYTVYIGICMLMAKLGLATPMQGIVLFATVCPESTFIILTISAITAGPVLEELLFRKIFYNYMRNYLSIPGAAFISSVFFAAMHFSLPHMPVLVFLGLIFQYSYIKSGSLTVPIILHATHNLIAMCMVAMIRSGWQIPGTY